MRNELNPGQLPGGIVIPRDWTREQTGRRSRGRMRAAVASSGLIVIAACSPPAGGTMLEADTSSQPTNDVRLVTVATGLEHPWGLAFLPGDEGILITERPGRLRIVRGGRLEDAPISGTPAVRAEGESGLLDVALHPRFDENRLVYLSYAKPGSRGSTTAVARGRFNGDRLTEVEDVFVADAWGSAAVNHGGRLAFDRGGHLLITVGDRREQHRAQDGGDHAGSTIRLLDDGRVHTDNPSREADDVRPEVFTLGHRNAIGLAVHPVTGEIWITENGAAGGDEINRLLSGRNYGWPDVSFGTHYDGRTIPNHRSGDGFEPPVHHWVPGISPSGLLIYEGDAFPDWRGDFFTGSLQARHLSRVRIEGGRVVSEERLLEGLGHRVRAVGSGPDGFIYLIVDGPSAPLLRLEPGQSNSG